MKILQLSKFYPPVNGGVESVVFELTEGLAARDLAVEVLCANTDHSTVVEREFYEVVRAGSLGQVLSTSLAPSLIWHLLKRHRRFNLIHVHLPDPMTNLALFIIRPNSKVVVHWHADIVAQKRALKLYAPLQNWLLRRADAIITTSEQYAHSSPWLKKFSDKVHVVHIGIQDPRPQPDDEHARRVAALRERFGGRRIVYSLGRMTYYKGFDVLIDAAAELPDDVCVVIGGSGTLLESLRAQVRKKGLVGKVHLVGAIPQRDLATFYAAADIFCLPSLLRTEAFGVVLLEAMAHALPVVASNIPGSGVPWVNQHGHTGLNVVPGDSIALAGALCQLLDAPDRARALGKNGRARYENLFTAKHMVDQVCALYHTLVLPRECVPAPLRQCTATAE
jgi:glycosyltransferase involved in cell wall biosynthesis